MSVPGTAAATTHSDAPFVRDAVQADHPAIRDVVAASYRQYADLIAPDFFARYLADLLDLDRHARHGRLFVAEVAARVRGFAAFYPDASVQGFGLPAQIEQVGKVACEEVRLDQVGVLAVRGGD
jgi:hypothetical protein